MEIVFWYLVIGCPLIIAGGVYQAWLWQRPYRLWDSILFLPFWPLAIDLLFCDSGPAWRREGYKTPEDWKKAKGYS